MHRIRLFHGAALLAAAAVGCHDIDVSNPNAPDLMEAFESAEALEAHVAGAFRDWYLVETARTGPAGMLSGVSFQHSTWAVCDAPNAELPRRSVENQQTAQCVVSRRAWEGLYRALTRVADGLRVLEAREDLREELGPEGTDRLVAFGRFVQGLAHGNLGLLFDQGAILDETVDRYAPGGLVDYRTLVDAALSYLNEAAELAAGASWAPVPAEWMSVQVSPDELATLAHSYAARFRANVARNPVERHGVDWPAVLADGERGIHEDWRVDARDAWHISTLSILYHPSRPTQASYFILGMADQGQGFERWLATETFQRHPAPSVDGGGETHPILIVTPDTRFPQGATVDVQMANPGSRFAVPTTELTGITLANLWNRPDRGTWRWSFYRWVGAMDYVGLVDTRWPLITEAEMRLLRAEAFLRTDNPGAAAALVNESRTLHGLRATDADGTNEDCVPRLPDGRCGDLLEMLKWEKRLETQWKGPFLASWFFDGRGWGDLHAGTFLHLPVPCNELMTMQEACYTFGGAGAAGTAPGSVYDWPHEIPGAG